MAVCSKCGKKMNKDVRFCKACGSGQGAPVLHDAKRARVLAGEKRGPNRAVLIAVAAAVVIAGWFGYSSSTRARTAMSGGEQQQPSREGNRTVQYTPVHAESGQVKVDAGALSGKAVYYIYDNGGRPVKFFLLRATDGTVRVALDACTACNHAKLGYRQEGDAMVCNNCGMAFRSTNVGKVSGGCSPIPLENRQDGATVVITARDLEAGAKYF